ncbi:MAG: hypothetical protein OXC92_02295 [Flavobacteriaceae bacterium]|nr:hypothetical protein [Flavobacteriaceae bacterium]MCY4267390.1 hypothetical protein [Flavobacteriaceae bacterium]
MEYSDISQLTLKVDNKYSRELINEAISAYRGGAFRSAIVSTWITIVFDFISKFRELNNVVNDSRLRKLTNELDETIKEEKKEKFQSYENKVLTSAKNFEIISNHELELLKRIKDDRNRCAHPSFNNLEEPYNPSPELVRTHIVHALQFVLIQAPIQGRKAMEHFKSELDSNLIPTQFEETKAYMVSRYLKKAKDEFVHNLIKEIIDMLLTKTMEPHRITILKSILEVIWNLKPAIYEDSMKRFIEEKSQNLNRDYVLNISHLVEVDSEIWNRLTDDFQTRFKERIKKVNFHHLFQSATFNSNMMDICEVSKILLNRFTECDSSETIKILSKHPHRKFVELSIDVFSSSSNYRLAEANGGNYILPLVKIFKSSDVKKLLEVAGANRQIYEAGGTKEILIQVFDQTRDLLPKTRSAWEKFITNQIKNCGGNESDYYAYPELQKKLESN